MRTSLTLAAAVVAVGLLTACSGSPSTSPGSQPSVDPSFVLTQARTNARAADAVHIRGTGQCDLGDFVVDMNLRKDGLGAGSVQVAGETLNLVSTKAAVYLHASRAFWLAQASAAGADRIGTKWVKTTRGASPCLTALSDFSLVLANYLDYPGAPTLLAGDKIQGVPARPIGLGSTVSVWVASSGTLLPVNVHDSATNTDISWSDWGSAATVVVPRTGTYIDGSTLGKA